VEISQGKAALTVKGGELPLDDISFGKSFGSLKLSALLNKKPAAFELKDGRLRFNETVLIKTGERLEVTG
jgi:hypothetical protein